MASNKASRRTYHNVTLSRCRAERKKERRQKPSSMTYLELAWPYLAGKLIKLVKSVYMRLTTYIKQMCILEYSILNGHWAGCMVGCGFIQQQTPKGHVSKTDWTLCSKFDNHSRSNKSTYQRENSTIYDNSKTQRIFTLTMNNKFHKS